jgi:hypothetical protein
MYWKHFQSAQMKLSSSKFIIVSCVCAIALRFFYLIAICLQIYHTKFHLAGFLSSQTKLENIRLNLKCLLVNIPTDKTFIR